MLDRFARNAHRLAVLLRDIGALTSGDPARIGRRIVNRALGRAVGRITRPLYLRRRRP